MRAYVCVLGLLSVVGLVGCASVLPPAHQQVVLQSNPPGAVVMINGDRRGQTPLVAQLLPREDYTVTFIRDGYHPFTQEIPYVTCQRRVGTLYWPDKCLVPVVDATLRPMGPSGRLP